MTGGQVHGLLDRIGLTATKAAELTGYSRRTIDQWAYRPGMETRSGAAFLRALVDALRLRLDEVEGLLEAESGGAPGGLRELQGVGPEGRHKHADGRLEGQLHGGPEG